MIKKIQNILKKDNFSKEEIVLLLKANEQESKLIFEKSRNIKKIKDNNKVYYRGLVEFSNICKKDCHYCGIRRSNKNTDRYEISSKNILFAAKFAHENKYGSFILQSGERTDKVFIDKVTYLLKEIKKLSNNELGVTISLGEQTEETYNKWFDAGAHRYLLRIEASNKELYKKLHPNNDLHSFEKRIEALKSIQKVGYQTGTGVMVALPFQTYENLADDLLFFKEFSIDMVGMGPYIEHEETPLYQYKDELLPQKERFELTLKMIAILRIMMPNINIAASTALQSIDTFGREKAIKIGANVIMPNITPTIHRKNYQLYQNKPCIDEGADDCTGCLENRIKLIGNTVAYNEWGDSKHFFNRKDD